MTISTQRMLWVAPLLAFGLLAGACGEGDVAGGIGGPPSDTPSDDGGSDGGSGDVSGDVAVSGSSTVEPISTLVAEMMETEHPDVFVNVDGPGTGDGFALFCEGQTHISDASRPIEPDEIESCEKNGIEFIELYIGIDGLSVLTHPDNDAVDCLNFADLYALVGPESTDVENWSDAAPLAEELGSGTQFPDARLDISAPGAESGTYDSFVELALADIAEERGEEEGTRNFPGQAEDSIIIQGIEGSPSSFGWVGFAFAENAADRVKELAIAAEPGAKCVEPTPDTISSGAYPLSRPLFIYVNAEAAEENAGVEAYVDYYLTDGIEAVTEAGYVAIPQKDLDATRSRWLGRETGSKP